MRVLAKRGIERVLAMGATPSLAAARMRGQVLVLAYHGIRPAGAPPAGLHSLHLGVDAFARQLDVICRFADVVSLDATLAAPASARPRVAITFDDAYRGAVEHGLPELVRRGLPATMFVAPGMLDQAFWWDAISPPSGAPDAAAHAHALEERTGCTAAVREWAEPRGKWSEAALPGWARAATLEEVRVAAALPSITIASHTWSHRNLARLDEAQLTEELGRPLEWMRRNLPGARAEWLAYPYGLTSPEVERIAQSLGYTAAWRVEGGWHRPDSVTPLALPRLNVPAGLSSDGLRLRLAALR